MLYSLRIGGLVNTDTEVKFHKDGYGYWAMMIKEDGTIETYVPDNTWEIHGFLMWTAWGVLGLV